MLPVIAIGFAAQRQIVKGLTVGAVKGGGRR
jgi:ABC-type glycerol-3-phosphate transport system permease component